MGHPGRPRRRNKVPVIQNHIRQPPPPQQHVKQPVKEEPTNSLHDESDLISFRNDALSKLIQNQELLEIVTSKYIHTSKIKPPSSFPEHAKRPQELNDQELTAYLKTLGPEGTYFGDYEVMKFVTKKLTQESENQQEVKVEFSDEYTFQKNAVERIAKLTEDLNDEDSLNKLEDEYNQILKEYKEKHNKTLLNILGYKTYSVKNPNVQEAPKDYNPRSINSMININQNQPQNNMNNMNTNMNTEFDNNFMFQNNKNLDDINNLFQRQSNDNMVDDMGDLINFQGDEGDIIEGGAFDEDFLSQIDHSME